MQNHVCCKNGKLPAKWAFRQYPDCKRLWQGTTKNCMNLCQNWQLLDIWSSILMQHIQLVCTYLSWKWEQLMAFVIIWILSVSSCIIMRKFCINFPYQDSYFTYSELQSEWFILDSYTNITIHISDMFLCILWPLWEMAMIIIMLIVAHGMTQMTAT